MFCVRFMVYGLLIVGLAGCVSETQQPQQKRLQQADVHFKLGISHLQANNPTKALKELLIAVENGPDNSNIHAVLAQAYQQKKAYPEAEHHYLQALSLSDNDPRYQNNLAALYLDMKQWDKAITYFDKAAGNLLFSNSHIALTGKAYAFFKKQDYPAALQQYQEVIETVPKYARAYYLKSETYQAMGQNEQAISTLEQALDTSPGYLPAIYQLGVLLLQKQQAVEATEKFERVVQLAPDSEWGSKAEQMLRALAKEDSEKNQE